jgi:membrane protein DedA with SNARE-associated domain
VFFARFVPVIRHMISLAAGIARMPLRRFALQTLLGATIWGWFLTFLGYFLGAKWESVAKVIKRFDLLFAVLIVLAVVFVVVRFIRKRRAARDAALATGTAEER